MKRRVWPPSTMSTTGSGDASVKAVFFSSLTNPVTPLRQQRGLRRRGSHRRAAGPGRGISVGQLSVFLSYANQYAKPFNEISGVVTELQNALACIQRVFDLLDAPDQIPDAADAAVLEPDGRVKLENVSFSYVPDAAPDRAFQSGTCSQASALPSSAPPAAARRR